MNGIKPIGHVTGYSEAGDQTFGLAEGQEGIPVGTDLYTSEQFAEAVAAEREKTELEMGTFVKNIMDSYPDWTLSQLATALKEQKSIRSAVK